MELRCDNVSYRYGRHHALDGVNVTFRTGMTGILGPNGAGKSTFLGILATVLKPKEGGSVTLDGRSLHGGERDELRRQIGFLPQRFDLMRWSSVRRNVAYAAWCQGVPRDECDVAAQAAIATVDLSSVVDRRVSALSGGQQQRVGIACAIAHEPTVVLLDEPTAGLDPAQRVQIRSYLARIAESAIVVLSTHIVEDLAQLASEVVVLEAGRTVYTGSVHSLSQLGSSTPTQGRSELEAGYVNVLSACSTGR